MDTILFDGECNLCDHSVQFILKRDSKARYQFSSIQSKAGQEILRKYGIPSDIDSFILIQGKNYYLRSSAALRVCRNLSGGWKLLYGLLLIPKPLRDYVYRIVAKYRYKWFGKKTSCLLPSPETRKRFL